MPRCEKEKKKLSDSKGVLILEKLPVVGYLASAGHGIAGAVRKDDDDDDEQRARRAAAGCTGSTVSTVLSVCGGAVGSLAGPPGIVAGAAAGACLGSLGGQLAEISINHKTKEQFRTERGGFKKAKTRKKQMAGEVILDTTIAAATAGFLHAPVNGGKTMAQFGKELTSKAVLNIGATGPAKKVAEESIESVVKTVLTAPIKGAGVYCKQSIAKPRDNKIANQAEFENNIEN